MDIVTLEPGLREHCRRLDLTVDSLLAQNCQRGPPAARDERSSDILFRIEAELDTEPGIGAARLPGEFLVGTSRIVAEPAHAPRCLGPCAAQLRPWLAQRPLSHTHSNLQLTDRRAEAQCVLVQPMPSQSLAEAPLLILRNLYHDSELLGEQLGAGGAALHGQDNIEA